MDRDLSLGKSSVDGNDDTDNNSEFDLQRTKRTKLDPIIEKLGLVFNAYNILLPKGSVVEKVSLIFPNANNFYMALRAYAKNLGRPMDEIETFEGGMNVLTLTFGSISVKGRAKSLSRVRLFHIQARCLAHHYFIFEMMKNEKLCKDFASFYGYILKGKANEKSEKPSKKSKEEGTKIEILKDPTDAKKEPANPSKELTSIPPSSSSKPRPSFPTPKSPEPTSSKRPSIKQSNQSSMIKAIDTSIDRHAYQSIDASIMFAKTDAQR